MFFLKFFKQLFCNYGLILRLGTHSTREHKQCDRQSTRVDKRHCTIILLSHHCPAVNAGRAHERLCALVVNTNRFNKHCR